MKFFTRTGGLDKQDITAVLTKAAGIPYADVSATTVETSSLMELYAAFLRGKIASGVEAGTSLPLSGLHIVVDAGNGAGGFFVQSVLEPLGADCSGSQFLEPDGNFPNHQPNPENRAAMESVRGAVTASKADLGIIFDTDVDRMSAVLSDGREVNRNAIIALMAAILAPEYPGATIVTDSITSDRLTAFLENRLGLRHHCFKRGYRNVINEAIRLNAEGVLTPLAIETSGHGALKENYFLDDGAYMAVRLVIAAAKAAREDKTLDTLLDGFVPAEHERELRISIAGSDFGDYGKEVIEACRERAEASGIEIVPSHEGLRLSFPGVGWLMLRVSLHDPILPLNAESGTAEGLEEILAVAKRLLSGLERSLTF
jgi:phosphomannomutase